MIRVRLKRGSDGERGGWLHDLIMKYRMCRRLYLHIVRLVRSLVILEELVTGWVIIYVWIAPNGRA